MSQWWWWCIRWLKTGGKRFISDTCHRSSGWFKDSQWLCMSSTVNWGIVISCQWSTSINIPTKLRSRIRRSIVEVPSIEPTANFQNAVLRSQIVRCAHFSLEFYRGVVVEMSFSSSFKSPNSSSRVTVLTAWSWSYSTPARLYSYKGWFCPRIYFNHLGRGQLI